MYKTPRGHIRTNKFVDPISPLRGNGCVRTLVIKWIVRWGEWFRYGTPGQQTADSSDCWPPQLSREACRCLGATDSDAENSLSQTWRMILDLQPVCGECGREFTTILKDEQDEFRKKNYALGRKLRDLWEWGYFEAIDGAIVAYRSAVLCCAKCAMKYVKSRTSYCADEDWVFGIEDLRKRIAEK